LLNLQFFDENELVINITENELVPKHILIPDSEKQSLLVK